MARKKKNEISSEQSNENNLIHKTEDKQNPSSFYGIKFNETDKDLSPVQQKEWTDIYASYRSKSPLSGKVIGVDTHRLTVQNPQTGKIETKEILCLIVMNFRVKVMIPKTEIWHDSSEEFPDFIVKNMIGAAVDYVIVNVDREGDCAIGSRKMALGYKRNRFLRDTRNEVGGIVNCNILVVGPNRIIAECNGFDLILSARNISYTAISDLRNDFKPGQNLNAKIKKISSNPPELEISVKEVNPNPFDGADKRHPVGARRQGVISGTYGGGLFCRLPDDTNVMCLYNPGLFTEEFYIDDEVLIIITLYDYKKKLIYGKILSKW